MSCARFQAVRHEYVNREIQLAETASKLVRLILRENELRQKLNAAEALFAQRELLNFTLSQRHSLEPLNVANATAGLPQIGWRQSVKRCKEIQYDEDKTMRYRIFNAIRRALAFAVSQEVAVSEGFRSGLMRRSSGKDKAVSELRRNWYFLRRAIETTVAREPVGSARLPFRITAEYLRTIEAATHADRIFAKDEALP